MYSIITTIQDSLQNNQFFAGMISVWILGTLTYLFRNFPKKIYDIILYNFTTSLVIDSNSNLYHEMLDKISTQQKKERFSKLQVTSREETPTIGLGLHFMKINNKWVKINIERIDTKSRTYDNLMYICTLVILGRNRVFFDTLIKQIKEDAYNMYTQNKLIINSSDANTKFIVPTRPLSSLFINENILSNITHKIDFFLNNEQWYIDKSIPYQLNILLHGFPGTGKTSLIKAIATHYKRNITFVHGRDIAYIINKTVSNEKDIFVFEDIDVNKFITNRESNNSSNEEMNSLGQFSDVINVMDGLLTRHGNIFIFTTNHISKLDVAFLRSGRMDIVEEIPYITLSEFNKFINVYFENQDILKGKLLKDNLTIADLQNDFISGLQYNDFKKKYMKEYVPIRWSNNKKNSSSKLLLLK